MFDELDVVVLTHNIKKHGLKAGDLGTVVHIYKNDKVLEVEFVTAAGKTVALLTLNFKDVRSITGNEFLHVRGFSSM